MVNHSVKSDSVCDWVVTINDLDSFIIDILFDCNKINPSKRMIAWNPKFISFTGIGAQWRRFMPVRRENWWNARTNLTNSISLYNQLLAYFLYSPLFLFLPLRLVLAHFDAQFKWRTIWSHRNVITFFFFCYLLLFILLIEIRLHPF